MIDTLVTIIDKSAGALKSKKTTEKQAFETLVKPLFSELKIVHDDYLRLFEGVKRHLSKEKPEVQNLAEQFMADRLTQESLRRSLPLFAKNYATHPRLQRYATFFGAVAGYFQNPNVWRADTRSEIVLSEIKRFAGIQQENAFFRNPETNPNWRETVDRVVDHYLLELRRQWQIVSSEYAKINAEVTTR